MGTRREGDLRLLKDGVVFGPTDRDGLARLLASGRIGQADFVSVGGADWVPIAEFLARHRVSASRAVPIVPTVPLAATAATPAAQRAAKKKGELQVLSGGRVIRSLTRDQVEQLATAGRLTDDDLICALNGPWMRLGDFFSWQVAEREAPSPSPIAATVPEAANQHASSTPVSPPASADVLTPPVSPPPEPPPPAGFSPPLIDPLVLPQPRAAAHASISYPLARVRPPNPSASDEWFVRVRGIHSAPLKKQHIKALYQAREVTLDCLARHAAWHENDWRPIHAITELAAVTRP